MGSALGAVLGCCGECRDKGTGGCCGFLRMGAVKKKTVGAVLGAAVSAVLGAVISVGGSRGRCCSGCCD